MCSPPGSEPAQQEKITWCRRVRRNRAVAAQCTAEGVEQHTAVVTGLVRSALNSPTLHQAATRRHWRETYLAATSPDGTLLEGYVDLTYQDDDSSLVIVDYKTDAVPAAALTARATYYTPQLRAYIDMLTAATGVTNIHAVLLFLHPERTAVKIPIPPQPATSAPRRDEPA